MQAVKNTPHTRQGKGATEVLSTIISSTTQNDYKETASDLGGMHACVCVCVCVCVRGKQSFSTPYSIRQGLNLRIHPCLRSISAHSSLNTPTCQPVPSQKALIIQGTGVHHTRQS